MRKAFMGLIHCCLNSLAFRIWALCFITVAYFYPGGGQNEAARYDAIRAYWVAGSPIIDNYVYNSADVIKIDGHFYSGKAPGTFFAGVPVYGFFDHVLNIFPLSPEWHDHLLCYLVSLFTVGLMGTLCAPLIFWFLRRKGYNEEDSAAVALTTFFGTILFPWSAVFFSHAATAFWIFLAFYQIYVFFDESIDRPGYKKFWRLVLAGFSIVMAVDFEYPSAIAAVLLSLYGISLWLRDRRLQDVSATVAGGILGGLPLLIFNYWAFRKFFYVPYEAYANDPNTTFTAHKHGLLGIRLPFLEPEFWPTFKQNFIEITWNPLRGILYANPILLLVIPGFVMLLMNRKKINREAWFALSLTICYLIFNAGYGDSIVYWGGGASFGPRHLTTMLPFLALPLAAVLQRQGLRRIYAFLALISVVFCFMATAVEPRTPYSPSNPIFQFYSPHFFAGQFAITKEGIFSSTPTNGSTVAFNAGLFLGLPRYAQLLPLALIWLLFGVWLNQALRVRKFLVFALLLAAIMVAPIFTH